MGLVHSLSVGCYYTSSCRTAISAIGLRVCLLLLAYRLQRPLQAGIEQGLLYMERKRDSLEVKIAKWAKGMVQSSMESLILEFDNARTLRSLYGDEERFLYDMESKLGVRMTTRDGWIRIEGKRAAVEKACSVFRELENARKRGVTIRRHEFQHALFSSTRPHGGNTLSELVESKIQCSPNKPPVVPRTAGQKAYIEAIKSSDITFGLGPAGTGKTYLAMALAVAALKQDKISRIVLTRPAVEAGEALGFLPGDLQDKILPYLRPFYDALHDMLGADEIQRSICKGVVEIAPLAYMRGRTLSHAFVVLDESQNTTTEQMFMFLTRLGVDSKCVITGDRTQIDLPRNKRSGLLEALAALKGIRGIEFHYFSETDVMRHPLVRPVIRAYQAYRGTVKNFHSTVEEVAGLVGDSGDSEREGSHSLYPSQE